MAGRVRRRLRWFAFALAAAGGAYGAARQPWAEAEPALRFSTVAVGRGSIAAQVTASGTLSARRTVAVGAEISGRVIELGADFGSTVRRGQLLARLDDSSLRAELERLTAAQAVASAERAQAEVAWRAAERILARQRELAAQGLVAVALVEEAELAVERAAAELAAARAQVAQAAARVAQSQRTLARAVVVSPIDGVVLTRAVDVGQTVAASLQAPTLFVLAEDLARLQIDTAVAEADVGRLASGMQVTFTVDAFPGERFAGVVRQVRNAPTKVQGVVTYDAVIDVDRAAPGERRRLRPGMTANVTFVVAAVSDAVTIPNLALRFHPSDAQLEALRAAAGEDAERGKGGGGRGDRGGGRGGDRGGERGRGATKVGFSVVAPRGPGGPGGQGGGPRGQGGAPRGQRARMGDRHAVWKLEDGKPKRVMIRPGVTDGSSTQLVEGELRPSDLLITEIRGG